MKVQKKIRDGIPFAKKEDYEYEGTKYEADIKNGDKITILNEGVDEVNQWGNTVYNFKVKTRNGDKKLGFNQKSINVLIESFGDDTTKWIGKDVNVILHKTIIGGERKVVAYIVTDGWSLDEYGDLVKEGVSEDVEDIPFD